MTDYRTIPNPALRPGTPKQPQHAPRIPAPRQPAPQRPRSRRLPTKKAKKQPLLPGWFWLIPAGIIVLLLSTLFAGLLTLNIIYDNRILPGVRVAGVNVGGLSPEVAAQKLAQQWQTVTLRDGERTWIIDAAQYGLRLDAEQTAAAAFAQGHGIDGMRALIKTVQVEPILQVDEAQMLDAFIRNSDQFEILPVNAGVRYDAASAQVAATLPENGRKVAIERTIQAIQSGAAFSIADGTFRLQMDSVLPAVNDAAPLLERARAILNNPLDIRIFDPVTGDAVYWSLPPQQWGNWLTITTDPASPIGLTLDADPAQVSAYLAQQAATALDSSRTVNIDAATRRIRQALQAGNPGAATITVQHLPRTYTVKAGDSITSIGWDFGMPYLYIQQANNNLQGVSIGQQITIPPADTFLKYDAIPDKRIVVDISEQRTRVYENGALKWDWGSSTGIADSPTWPGIYQVISHEPNAYAGNWNLYMPNFIGVYQPIPGSEFTNGFHGFPTRGGGQLLWQNSIGTRVTYGCILLNDTNAQLLYNWAEEGVVVEIRP